MANTIGTAYIQIEPSTEGISGSISSALNSEASSAGKSAGSTLSSALGTAAKTGVAAVTGLATAVTGAGAALVSAASDTAEYGDNIDKLSQKLGVSSDFYQEWDAVLQHSGTSMSSMTATFKTLANASQDASADQQAAFEKLGLSMEQVASMSTEELFSSVISGLQGMEEGTERTAIATDLLGRGAMEMGALLNTSAEDTQAMIDTVNELGGVMSGEAVKAAAGFQDSLRDMQTAMSGIKNTAMAELLPGFSEIMNGFSGLITGSDTASQQLQSGFSTIASSITSGMPTIINTFSSLASSIMEVAPEIISALAGGIISAIPDLFPTITDLVVNLGSMLIEKLPELIKAGLEVIVQLAEGIAQSLPELIPTIVDVVLEITDTLIDNIDLLIDGAIALILGLAEGLINALPQLIERIPEIVIKLADAFVTNAPKLLTASIQLIKTLAEGLITNIPNLIKAVPSLISALVDKFKSYVSSMLSIGADIVNGIRQGISNAWQNLLSWLGGLCSGLIDKVKSALKIGSPSKLFRDEVGQWIPAGIAVGIESNSDVLDSAMDDMMSPVMTVANSGEFESMASANGSEVDATSGDTFSALYDILNTYLPQLANMQVVMDTGTTVGVLAPGMNTALGRISAREGYR